MKTGNDRILQLVIATLPVVKIGEVSMDGSEPVFMLGPCVIESEPFIRDVSARIKKIADEAGVKWIFKASYDKANRSSISSYRGMGCKEGCALLALRALGDMHGYLRVSLAVQGH